MTALAVTVLMLVFVDEVLAMAALGVGGHHLAGWPLAIVLPIVGCVIWGLFASPRAPYGGQGARAPVKVLVFCCATVALFVAGHPVLGVLFLLLTVVVNGLAHWPALRAAAPEVMQ